MIVYIQAMPHFWTCWKSSLWSRIFYNGFNRKNAKLRELENCGNTADLWFAKFLAQHMKQYIPYYVTMTQSMLSHINLTRQLGAVTSLSSHWLLLVQWKQNIRFVPIGNGQVATTCKRLYENKVEGNIENQAMFPGTTQNYMVF